MNKQEIVNKLTAIGGNEWHKFTSQGQEMHRVYFNQDTIIKLAGYTYETYSTGNISSAHRDGEVISNSAMKRVFGSLISEKFYYDVLTGKFSNTSADVCLEAQAAITASIRENAVV
jgi:hypothetical protein